MRQGSGGVGVKGKWRWEEGGLLLRFCIWCRSVTLPPSVASLFFFREQFVLARKMSRYPVSSASLPPSPLHYCLSRSLQLSLTLALLLRLLKIRSFLFLRFERGNMDSPVQITEEEGKMSLINRLPRGESVLPVDDVTKHLKGAL